MVISGPKISGGQGEPSRAWFRGNAKIPSLLAKPNPGYRRAHLRSGAVARCHGAVQVFASANDVVVNTGGTRPVVAQGGKGAIASAGVTLAAGPLTKGGQAIDTLLVAGGEGAEAAAEKRVLVDWVRQRATRARRVAFVCTGAFLLAAAGLLDGRRGATHWKYCVKLAQPFPAVHVEPDPIFV